MDESYNYDLDSKKAGWDSPERAQKLVEPFISNGSVVLDIGIGTGQAIIGYAQKGATIIGIDQDKDMLEKVKEIIGENGLLRKADINDDLPIDDLIGLVDVVQAVGVLEFSKDLNSVFKKVHKVLKINGLFVFTVEIIEDVNQPSVLQYSDINIIVYRHTTEEVKSMLEMLGFKVDSADQYIGYQRDEESVPYCLFLAHRQ